MRRRVLALAVLSVGGFGVATIASSAPQPGVCKKKPNHPACVTTSTTTPTTTTVPTTAPPPTTTTAPPPSGGDVANLWVVP